MEEKQGDIKGAAPMGLVRPMMAIVALLLVSHATFAADLFGWMVPDIVGGLFTGNFWSNAMNGSAQNVDFTWMWPCFLALGVGVLLASVAYLISGVFGQRVHAWGKNQLKEMAKSAIIIVFVFAAFNLTNAPAHSAFEIGAIQMQNAVYFVETVRNTLTLEFLTMTSMTAILSMLGTLVPNFRLGGMVGISFSLAPAFRPIFDGLGIMLSMMSVAVGEWFVNGWLLSVVRTQFLSILLPIGLFLRSVTLDKAGDFLIAVAIGFFFVYPFMLNVSALATTNYLTAELGGGALTDLNGASHSMTGTDIHHSPFADCVNSAPARFGTGAGMCFFKLQMQPPLEFIVSTVGSVTTLLAVGVIQFMTGGLGTSIVMTLAVLFMLSMLKTVAFYVVVVSILMPLFDIFVTLTVIKELASWMGTTIDISAFERLF